MAKKKIFSVQSLKDKKFHTLEFNEFYTKLMGKPERKFTMMCYGESGSGKSVFLIQFANYFAKNFGKSFYNSHEEGANKTIQDRLNNFNIDALKLYVADAMTFDEMCTAIEKNYYRLVVIDSVKYMGFTFNQLRELRKRFANRLLCICIVDFGSSKGSPDSGKDLLHASDVKMYFKNGRIYSISRYLDAPIEHQLFFPQKSANQHPTLF